MKAVLLTLCGLLFVGQAFAQNKKLIADFEQGSSRPFSGGRLESKTVIRGLGSMRLEKSYATLLREQDWTGFDYLRFEVRNPQKRAVNLLVEIRDRQTQDYWTRVNLNLLVQPGLQTLSVPTAIYVGEKGRIGRALLRDQITHFIVNVGPNGPLIFDDFRLEKSDASNVLFPGLKAFDFGPEASPVMDGFTPVNLGLYKKARGFGWAENTLWKTLDVHQPESLTQDFVFPENSTFKLDVPNGMYRVHMNIDCPGGYWGEVPAFTNRSIRINGRVVLNEDWNYASFLKHYFRHAEEEDLPDVDPFEKYILPALKERTFDVRVEKGQIQIAFDSENWAVCLTHVYVYPIEKEAEGAAFSAWVKNKRKKLFNAYFGKKEIAPSGRQPAAKGYHVFSRRYMQPVHAQDGPRDHEDISRDGWSLSVAKDEETAVTFSLQSNEALGDIHVTCADFKDADGNPLAAGTVIPGWLDYRITRKNQEGSVYSIEPRYWRTGRAPFTPGITRRFWLRVKPGRDARSGVFQGQVVIKPEKGVVKKVPMILEVLPFELDPITDVAVGPWGSGMPLPWLSGSKEKQAWDWTMFEKTLDALKDTGCTSFSGRPHLSIWAWEGVVRLKTETADREMALIRSKGFDHLISSYGILNHGYHLYDGVNQANTMKRKFESTEAMYRKMYEAVDRHAVEKNWTPVAWTLCDEPGLGTIEQVTANVQKHRQAIEGLDRTTFMGATSLKGNIPDDPHVKLAKALPVASLNTHDAKAIETIQQAGNTFSFYNGANRWTLGRYMRMLVKKHKLGLRLTWHYNNVAGNPYFALDCREDDYCWFNTNANQELIPSVHYLTQVLPGLNDYRYLVTLERILEISGKKTRNAYKLLDAMLDLEPGTDRVPFRKGGGYTSDRAKIVRAIMSLLE